MSDDDPARARAFLEPGTTCWRVERAGRVALIVDARDYFEIVAEAMERARRSIRIVGWDVHSRMRLRRGEDAEELGPFLDRLARGRRELEIHVLAWDFAMIYALEREPLPIVHFGLRTHRRVRFELDGHHPIGASHHQKIVVVDDAVAFVGGIDLTVRRWDTPAHRVDESRRTDPSGERYGPFHDVALAVSGDAASAVAEVARTRWERATGERLGAVPAGGGDPWPAALAADLEDVAVGVARTEPAYGGRDGVGEIEALYVRAIGRARRTIYLENQYLTSATVTDALATRLAEEDGPEVLVVMPERQAGWLENATMGALRAGRVRRLREADRRGRFRLATPRVPGGASVKVHAKVAIVDDAFLTVGSANLSNRSMGLDSECNLALEGAPETIARWRARLLGEHLGRDPAEVAAAIAHRGSLLAAVDALGGGARTLEPFEPEADDTLLDLVEEPGLLDPERPMHARDVLERFLGDRAPGIVRGRRRRTWIRLGAGVAVVAGLALAWRFGPLAAWIDPDRIAAAVTRFESSGLAPLVALAAFVAGGFVMAPVTALIVASAIAFGPLRGFGYALLGSLASAAATYGAGRVAGRATVRRLAGPTVNRVAKRLGRRGVLAIAAVRLLPIAPFTVVNLAAGASEIPFGAFMVGTLAGMAPGVLAMTVFADRLLAAIADPGPGTVLVAVAVAAIVAGGAIWMRRGARRRDGSGDGR